MQRGLGSRSGQPRLQKPGAVQPKAIPASWIRQTPAAPAVYRPQPLPRVLQGKITALPKPPNQTQRSPVAPPVYRPQPVPKVLQTKIAVGQRSQAERLPRRQASAPPVFRPQPMPRVLQTKAVQKRLEIDRPEPGKLQGRPLAGLELKHGSMQRTVQLKNSRSGGILGAGGRRSGVGTIQAKWIATRLNDEYWRWHTVVNGLRWYKHKREDYDLYYYIVEQPTRQNAHLIDGQGYEARRGDFSVSGGDEPPFGPIDPVHEEVFPTGWEKSDYAPFIFNVVKHKTDGPRWTEVTAHRQKANQQKFQKTVGAATRHPVGRGEVNPGLKTALNVGAYVFHLSTLRNLVFAPHGTVSGTGIISRGLDPGMGGGPGGACETCTVLNDQSMLTGSIKNSKNVVAVTTAMSNLKMYANQRHEYTATAFGKKEYSEQELVGRESVLLRFRLKQSYIDVMEVDPQHPNDEFVQLIRGIRIPPEEIEALTGEGWKPISALAGLADLFPDSRPRVSIVSMESGPNTTPLPNPWLLPQVQLPRGLDAVLRGANGRPNPDFWNALDRVIEQLAPNWFAIRGLLTALQQRNRHVVFRLREMYQEDLGLMLGYPGRVDEDVQRRVISLIDEVVNDWNSNRPRFGETGQDYDPSSRKDW